MSEPADRIPARTAPRTRVHRWERGSVAGTFVVGEPQNAERFPDEALAENPGGRADAAPRVRVLGDRASRFPRGHVGTGGHMAEFTHHRKSALAQG